MYFCIPLARTPCITISQQQNQQQQQQRWWEEQRQWQQQRRWWKQRRQQQPQHMGLQFTDNYDHTPERIINVNGTTIMCNVLVITDRTILANWPDIVLHDKREKTCLLININTPDDAEVNTKETEKLSKYKELEIDVSRMWKMSAIKLQKITLMSTAHIICKALG